MSKIIRQAPQACSAPVQPTNWDICVLCQEHGGTLINPSEMGYTSLTTNLSSLHELNKVPLNIHISRLDDGDGMKETLVTHKAKWHKACYVMCNATTVERSRKLQEKACQELAHSPLKHHLRSRSAPSCSMETEEEYQPACFFCDETTGDFQRAETISIDIRVRQIATELQDAKLFAKLSVGDMVAIDAVYHFNCLTSFYNRHISQQRHSTEKCHQINQQSLALAEVVYIAEYGQSGGGQNHVFTLSDLKALYCERLQQLGGDTTGHVHIPSLEVHNSNSGTVLSFKEDFGNTLLDACHFDSVDEAVMLMRAAKLVRNEVFENKYHINSSLCDEQYDNLPTSLSALVGIILGGSNARQRLDDYQVSTSASSITQLLVFNAVKRGRRDLIAVRHNLDRETVLPLYVGLLIHNRTRKREKGMSVSTPTFQLTGGSSIVVMQIKIACSRL